MKMQKQRLFAILGGMIALVLLLSFAPFPIRGHWTGVEHWNDREDPIFVTYVDGRRVCILAHNPASPQGTYERRGLRYVVNELRTESKATAYATPFLLFYNRPSKGESFIRVRDLRSWVSRPTLTEVASMQFDSARRPTNTDSGWHAIPEHRIDAEEIQIEAASGRYKCALVTLGQQTADLINLFKPVMPPSDDEHWLSYAAPGGGSYVFYFSQKDGNPKSDTNNGTLVAVARFPSEDLGSSNASKLGFFVLPDRKSGQECPREYLKVKAVLDKDTTG